MTCLNRKGTHRHAHTRTVQASFCSPVDHRSEMALGPFARRQGRVWRRIRRARAEAAAAAAMLRESQEEIEDTLEEDLLALLDQLQQRTLHAKMENDRRREEHNQKHEF